MNFLLAFLFAGLACSIGELILDNTKLTPGHITSIYTVIGAILSFLGIYDKLINTFSSGATILISNFGHALYSSAWFGYLENGFLGIFTNMFYKSSGIITGTIIIGFLVSLIFKPKN